MIKLTIDREKLQGFLDKHGWSYSDIADKIKIKYMPTERVTSEWKRGNISNRWLMPIANTFNIEPILLSKKVSAKRALSDIQEKDLLNVVAIEVGVTRSAVGSWLSAGGGIDIERLISLCEELAIEPYQILSDDTKRLMIALATGEGDHETARDILF